jgi:hypothetical protein
MAIARIHWYDYGARDIHLIPGLEGPRLDQSLLISDTGIPGDPDNPPSTFRADSRPDNISYDLTFRANFAGAPSSRGVLVNGVTGVVTVPDPLPVLGLRLRTFIVTAKLTQGDNEFVTQIRVYVHNSVQSRWLTPSQLTVRQGASNMRFSVLARFDDGVIGDISNWCPRDETEEGDDVDLDYVHRIGGTQPVHVWTPQRGDPSTAMYVNPVTGEIGCDDPTARVKVSVQMDLGNPLASAYAIGAQAWETPVRLTRIAGPGFAAIGREGLHNVLILPDGFVDDPHGADRAAFNNYARRLVTLLTTNSHTRPFDLIADKFNFFSAWVPSPQAGISAMSEQRTFLAVDEHTTEGRDVELPERFDVTNPPAEFSLEQLIWAVGLPTPVFEPPDSDSGDDDEGRVHDWAQLYGSYVTEARVDPEFDEWNATTTRTLINERDTAFHVANDDRPRADESNSTTLSFHPLRLTKADFDKFLDAVQDSDSNPLPGRWSEGGDDDKLVIILCRSNFRAGTNVTRGTGRYLCVTLDGGHTRTYRDNPDGNGSDLVPDPVPDRVGLEAWATVAHEVAHSFTLDDEYGGNGKLPETEFKNIDKHSNTQQRAALVDGDDNLSADHIKWRWPRLNAAGVLTDPSDDVSAVRPDPSRSGRFLVTVAHRHGAAFEQPEVSVVKLRTPTLLSRNLRFSGPLLLTDVNGDELTVEPAPGVTLDPDDFSEGDLVVSVVRTPDPNIHSGQFGEERQLVHPLVVSQINVTRQPLNAPADPDPDRDCEGEVDEPTWATNFDKNGLTRPRLSYRLVGLYENGHTYDCGVYRPSGLCIMNDTTTVSRKTGRIRMGTFCHVCRYALVDAIDPAAHRVIDRDYSGDYPE